MFKSKKTRKVTVEQSKLASLEHVPEEPSDPLPSVVVDHDRLKVMELKNKLTCNMKNVSFLCYKVKFPFIFGYKVGFWHL